MIARPKLDGGVNFQLLVDCDVRLIRSYGLDFFGLTRTVPAYYVRYQGAVRDSMRHVLCDGVSHFLVLGNAPIQPKPQKPSGVVIGNGEQGSPAAYT